MRSLFNGNVDEILSELGTFRKAQPVIFGNYMHPDPVGVTTADLTKLLHLWRDMQAIRLRHPEEVIHIRELLEIMNNGK